MNCWGDYKAVTAVVKSSPEIPQKTKGRSSYPPLWADIQNFFWIINEHAHTDCSTIHNN